MDPCYKGYTPFVIVKAPTMNDHTLPSQAQQETYATAYYYFFQALELLAQDAETQCKRLDFFNVAWEIADDITRGAELLTSIPGGHLSDAQRQGIAALQDAVSALPKAVIFCVNSHEGHLAAMNHPAWLPLRARATALISELESETKKNAEYFRQGQ